MTGMRAAGARRGDQVGPEPAGQPGQPGPGVPFLRSVVIGLALFVLGVLKYGIGPFPSFELVEKMVDAWAQRGTLPPEAGYLGYSPLHTILLGTLGLQGWSGIMLGGVALAAAAVVLPVTMPSVRADPWSQALVVTVIAGGAVLPDLVTWTGSYDPVIVLAGAVAALARNRWVQAGGWFILGVQHAPIALLSLVVWAVVVATLERGGGRGVPWARFGLAGVATAAGAAVITGLADLWQLDQSRGDFLDAIGGPTAVMALYWPLAWVTTFSVLGVVWFLLLDERLRALPAARVLAVLALVIGVVLPQLVLDHVRVPALVLLPPTLALVARLPEVLEVEVRRRLVRRYLPIAVILPVILVWEGRVYLPGFSLLGP